MKDAIRTAAIAACGMDDYEPTPEDMQRIAWAVAAFLRALPSFPLPEGMPTQEAARRLAAAVAATDTQ